MGCDAVNVGAYDLSLGVDYLLEKQTGARFPLLSANLTDPQGKELFTPYVLLEASGVRVGVFGLIDDHVKLDKVPGGDRLAVRDPGEVAREIVNRLRDDGAGIIVLLTNMEGRPLRRLSNLGLPIDVIIGSDKRNQISLPVVTQDTFITHLDRGGKSVGRLEIVFGGADHREGADGTIVHGTRVGSHLLRNHFEQLRLEIPDHPEIGPRVAAVEAQAAAMQKQARSGNDRGESDCAGGYVGVALCGTCHPGRYRQWQSTDHSRAFATLVARGKQYDEECLDCHVVVYECEPGQTETSGDLRLANVQCESCHGPGEAHAASAGDRPTEPMERPEDICLRCHTTDKTDDMDFAAVAKRICTDQGD